MKVVTSLPLLCAAVVSATSSETMNADINSAAAADATINSDDTNPYTTNNANTSSNKNKGAAANLDDNGVFAPPCKEYYTCELLEYFFDDLSPDIQEYYEKMGWNRRNWGYIEGIRWYYVLYWEELSDLYQKNLSKLGWTEDKWDAKMEQAKRPDGEIKNGHCQYDRPLVELRPWSRLTDEEKQIVTDMGLNEYSWHTKEYKMIAWQDKDGFEALAEDLEAVPTVDIPNNGFHPVVEKLDIPEFKNLTWDILGKVEDTYVMVDDPDDIGKAKFGNDEFINQINMTMAEFIKGVQEGKHYYIKYENEEQKTIKKVIDYEAADILEKALYGTEAGEMVRIGPKYDNKDNEPKPRQISMLYIGGKSTTTKMHLDIQSYNFLYVTAGKKRIRMLPNDQRYAKNFTWGYETDYSVWTGYDLLNEPLPPGGVEVILGPGEGVAVPYMTWHAVENIEPSIAFGFIRDFQYTESLKVFCAGGDVNVNDNDEPYSKIEEKERAEAAAESGAERKIADSPHELIPPTFWETAQDIDWDDIDTTIKTILVSMGWDEDAWEEFQEEDFDDDDDDDDEEEGHDEL